MAGLSVDGLALQVPGAGSVTLDAARITLEPQPADSKPADSKPADPQPGDHTGESDAAVRLRLTGLSLPQDGVPGLGNRLDRLELDALLRGTVPSGPPAAALRAWRDAGGVLDIRQGTAQWGTLEVSGSGTLALDKAMQPMAALSVVVKGLDQAIDGLAQASLISSRDARLATLATAALAQPAADGDGRELRLPLSIQDRTVFLGPLKLMRLPPIRWE
jgi:hypothetical protein